MQPSVNYNDKSAGNQLRVPDGFYRMATVGYFTITYRQPPSDLCVILCKAEMQYQDHCLRCIFDEIGGVDVPFYLKKFSEPPAGTGEAQTAIFTNSCIKDIKSPARILFIATLCKFV
jgi:hypothetical protein